MKPSEVCWTFLYLIIIAACIAFFVIPDVYATRREMPVGDKIELPPKKEPIIIEADVLKTKRLNVEQILLVNEKGTVQGSIVAYEKGFGVYFGRDKGYVLIYADNAGNPTIGLGSPDAKGFPVSISVDANNGPYMQVVDKNGVVRMIDLSLLVESGTAGVVK